MATIVDPAATRAVAVRMRQPLRLGASASTNWWSQANGGTFAQINTPGVPVSVFVWETPSSVTRRFTFDDIQIIAQDTQPSPSATGGLRLNLCEGPPAILQATDQMRNEALEDPPLRPFDADHDDPPLGTPLVMPGANRDRMGTVRLEGATEAGGPANLTSLYGPGLFVDTAGYTGSRTPIARARGLGPFPAAASYHHGGLYFNHDFGKSRTIGLTRVLFEDAAGNVAVVRGDGRRNTYRVDAGSQSGINTSQLNKQGPKR